MSSTLTTLNPWDIYPKHKRDGPPDVHHRGSYHLRLLNDSGRLFAPDQVKIDVVHRNWEASLMQRIVISDMASLDVVLKLSETPDSDTILILRQKHSWDHILVSLEIIQKILWFYDIFPNFLDTFHAFGSKTTETDENFDGFSYQSLQMDNPSSYETCYNIRYMAENGRNMGVSWSVRQAAIYEKYESSTRRRQWILIQPSEVLEQQLLGHLGYNSSNLELLDPEFLHISFFLCTEHLWREYINFLEGQLTKLETKALFCSVGRTRRHDYSVTFTDSQRLQELRKKLLQACSILESSFETASNYIDSSNRRSASRETIPNSMDYLKTYLARIKMHIRSVRKLLEHSSGILQEIFQILHYRNDEILCSTNEEIQRNGNSMSELIAIGNRENGMLAELNKEAQRDSSAMKILTIVASLYLPATLVAAVFSSDLVQLKTSDNQTETRGHFVPAPQFWMYPVFTLVLMAITMIPAMFWIRYSSGPCRNPKRT